MLRQPNQRPQYKRSGGRLGPRVCTNVARITAARGDGQRSRGDYRIRGTSGVACTFFGLRPCRNAALQAGRVRQIGRCHERSAGMHRETLIDATRDARWHHRIGRHEASWFALTQEFDMRPNAKNMSRKRPSTRLFRPSSRCRHAEPHSRLARSGGWLAPSLADRP
jgi:hypothetical protein